MLSEGEREVKVIHECLLTSFVLSLKVMLEVRLKIIHVKLLLLNNLQHRMSHLHICT
jgi:hypothetical protein